MKLKPKSTTKNPRALLYKRFIGLEKSLNVLNIYETADDIYWTFDALELSFNKIDESLIPQSTSITQISSTSILQFQGSYFRYGQDGWEKITNVDDNVTLLNAKFNNIAKYQMNKYYYVGSFDFMIKGSIEGATAQYIKGNILPLNALNIKYFNDDIKLSPDDLVVIENKLFSVENSETVLKQQPKPYKIYFATLNNIL